MMSAALYTATRAFLAVGRTCSDASDIRSGIVKRVFEQYSCLVKVIFLDEGK